MNLYRTLQWRGLVESLSVLFESRLSHVSVAEYSIVPHRQYPQTVLYQPLKRGPSFTCNSTVQVRTFTLKMGCGSSKVEVNSKAPAQMQNSVKANSKSDTEQDDDYVEGIVCQTTDLEENQMKTFDLEDVGKVLVVKQKGKLSAVGAKCTHYGALLHTGALGDGRVRCPWHGACFNLETGDIEDFPGLDSLPCYQVKVENDNVVVRAKRKDLETNKRVKSMAKLDKALQESAPMVIIGGGPAGATCVETLRQEGYTGRIVMISKEDAMPYDRVKVSKAMDVPLTKIEFRTAEFYKEHDIEIFKAVAATKLDTDAKLIHLRNGNRLAYDKVFIATGCTPLKPDSIEGVHDVPEVAVLRDHTDSLQVLAQAQPDSDVVVLGSSFIALEAAAYLVSKVKSVTVIARDTVPFRHSLGAEAGQAIKDLFVEKNVQFNMGSGIVGCVAKDGHLTAVKLKDGSELKADLLILGVGSTLNTEFLRESKVPLVQSHQFAVEVDDYLKTSVADVYAGGDIALAPVFSNAGKKAVIGHYPLAHMHGRIAALNMLGKTTKLEAVPFFWTMLFGKGIRYSGHSHKTPDTVLYHGDIDKLKYVGFHLVGDQVVGVSSCGMDPVCAQYAELLAQGKQLYRADLEGGDMLKWTKDY